MKRIFAIVIAMIMALGICSAQAATINAGILGLSAVGEDEFELLFTEHMKNHNNLAHEYTMTYYDNMNSLIMALNARDIFMIFISSTVADYMVSRNDALHILPGENGAGLEINNVAYTMMLRGDDHELQTRLNDAIAAIKASGKMEAILEEDIKAVISGSDPKPVQMPVIEGAPTITIAVTGDLPPMDFVTADGSAAGFNASLLAAISEEAQVNIKLLTVDTAARLPALSSGRADVIFWSRMNHCEQHPGYDHNADLPEGFLITDPYFTDSVEVVILTDSLRYLAAEQ